MRAHLLFDPHFDPHLAVILKDLVHVLCDASRWRVPCERIIVNPHRPGAW